MGNQIGSKPVAGGSIYMEAIDEAEGGKTKSLTTTAMLRTTARYINQGLSVDHAVDIVSKDSMHMPDKVDVVKAAAKTVMKATKGMKGY
jgi:hypothetical protein